MFEKIYQADGTKCSRTALIKTSAERYALKKKYQKPVSTSYAVGFYEFY